LTDPSPVSVRVLTAAKDEPVPEEVPRQELEVRARAKLNANLRGWRLGRLLGVGPVTAAYEAVKGTKDAADKAVVKMMIGNAAKHERAKSLFLRAAYAANRFQHARVLPVVEDGTDGDGAAYVVRPWVDAEPLDEAVAKRAAFGQEDVLRVAEQVLDALEMAHAHGIIHGGITPSNILVTPRGSIRLCDFATPPGMGARATTELDAFAQLRMGPFTAPERCATPSPAPSEQGDVWSLAACMYHAISRQHPRGDARSAEELARMPAKPLREVMPNVSESIAAVIDHALAVDPIYRYESAYAMLGDVRRVMAGRKPKLSDSAGPIPSQSTVDLGAPASSRRIPLGRAEGSTTQMQPLSVPPRTRRGGSEWKGNVLLILAIATLVGLATFVVVKEKMEEQRDGDERPSRPVVDDRSR